MGSNPIGASELFLDFICNCEDHFHLYSLTTACTHMIFITNTKFIHVTIVETIVVQNKSTTLTDVQYSYEKCDLFLPTISNLNFPGSMGSGGCLITWFPGMGTTPIGTRRSWKHNPIGETCWWFLKPKDSLVVYCRPWYCSIECWYLLASNNTCLIGCEDFKKVMVSQPSHLVCHKYVRKCKRCHKKVYDGLENAYYL